MTRHNLALGLSSSKTPKQIVKELKEHIVGHEKALTTMGNAMRYRWRRRMLDGELRNEVTPKNILMIGNTGIGKTEIARRIAILESAPFLKVEATKFTEVGYVGRDVESMIRDLVEIAYLQEKERHIKQLNAKVERIILHKLAKIYLSSKYSDEALDKMTKVEKRDLHKKILQQLSANELDEEYVELEQERAQGIGIEILTADSNEELNESLQSILLDNVGSESKSKNTFKISDAFSVLRDEEMTQQVNEKEIKANAISAAQEYGIIFVDEIDKLISKGGHTQSDVSRDGVQRDLLSIIEGTTISTKYGSVQTDHILFIAAGAFIGVRETDLISELQGRFPVRVKLSELTSEDLANILTKPKFNLIRQYTELLACDAVDLEFTSGSIRTIADYAFTLNQATENIGARRLHALLEKLLEEISFNAPPPRNVRKFIRIDTNFVKKTLATECEHKGLDESIL